MNSRAYSVLFLFILWCLSSGWFYVCKVKQKCSAIETIEEVDVPIGFSFGGFDVVKGTSFTTYRDNLLEQLGEDNKIKVVGKYDKNESNTSGFDNLGIARASAVRNLMPELADYRFLLTSKAVDYDSSEKVLAAADFKIMLNNEFVEETEFGAIIHFKANEPDEILNPSIQEYLNQLVRSNAKFNLDVIGHSDNAGSEGENYSLGLERANKIRDLLVTYGMSEDRIYPSSRGETDPVTGNDSEDGMIKNRRVEILINKY